MDFPVGILIVYGIFMLKFEFFIKLVKGVEGMAALMLENQNHSLI